MGFRNYDPGLNRFLTRDSYSGALADMSLATDPFTGNRYAFAGGNPISFVELDGHLFGLSLSDIGHAALDVVGLIPVVGEVADVANGIWYAAEGNYVDAALSMSSAIPFAGYAATAVKAGRYVQKGVEAVDTANDVKKAENTADAATPPKPKTDEPQAPSCPVKRNSFVPGTKVLMADGSTKDIEDLKEGEFVLAADPETGDVQGRQITDTRDHAGKKTLVTLTVDTDGEDGDAKPSKITSTDEHPYWVPDFGTWFAAGELKPGMWLQTAAGTWVQITAVDVTHRGQRVHNLTVEGQHDFYVQVGGVHVLTHNEDRRVAPGTCPISDDEARQLLDDAEAIHDARTTGMDPDSTGARIAEQGTTVATGVFGGRKYYTTNNNRATPAMKDKAEELGYERLHGVEFTTPRLETDAEQIFMNARQDGTLVGPGTIASSRKACGPSRQNCAGRANDPEFADIELWERDRVAPWDRKN
jgi:RHS repeat-associated protein